MPTRRRPEAPTRTVICFVRHGTTPTTGKILPGRTPGLHLSDQGQSEAERAGERLGALGNVSAVYSSPLERARETASAIARQVGQKVVIEKGLLECDFGDWTGAELAKLRKLPEWSSVMQHPSGFCFPNGESFGELRQRITAAVDRLAAKHTGQVIVAVSHADPIKIAIGEALGVSLDLVQRTIISPGSVSVVSYGSLAPSVLAVNSGTALVELGISSEKTDATKGKK